MPLTSGTRVGRYDVRALIGAGGMGEAYRVGRPHPPGWLIPDRSQEEYVDLNVANVTEMRRGLDYLETRPDIDRTRIAMLGISAGGGPGVFVTALEPRYRSVVFAGTGIPSRLNYAPSRASRQRR